MDKIDEYRENHLGYLRLLGLSIDQVPQELGRAELSLTIEVLAKDGTLLSTQFTGVQQLRIGGVTPECSCYLQIASVAADQLEGLRYKVFNGEQDVTLSFYCNDFQPTQSRVLP